MANREHSSRELQTKLQMRGFEAQDCRRVIDDLARKGLQSDLRFAQGRVAACVRKGYGPMHIKMDLRNKGVDQTIIDAALKELESGWEERLRELYQRRYRQVKAVDSKEKAKRFRFLEGKGYRPDQIMAILQGEGVVTDEEDQP